MCTVVRCFVCIFVSCLVCNCCWLAVCIVVVILCVFVALCLCICCMCLCICCTVSVYLLHYVCIAVFFLNLDAGLLARSQYSEGPATGHLDTGFSWFHLCL